MILNKISHQVFLLLGFQGEIQRARLQRGVLRTSKPQVGAAAGGREEESPSADHGAETQTGGVLLFGGWRKLRSQLRLPGRCGGFGGLQYRGPHLFIAAVDITQPLKYSWPFLTLVTLLSTFVSLDGHRKGPDQKKSRVVKGGFQKTLDRVIWWLKGDQNGSILRS